MKKLILLFLTFSIALGVSYDFALAEGEKVEVNFFYSATCPHCKNEKEFLKTLQEKYSWIDLREYEIIGSKENQKTLLEFYKKYNVPEREWGTVPVTFTPDKYFIGFGENCCYQAINIKDLGEKGIRFDVCINDKIYPFVLNFPGEHNIYNALCAIAVGVYFHVDVKMIQEGIEEGLIKRELDPALSALTFMAIHHGVLHQWVLNRHKLDGRDYVKTFRKILMDGLKA